MLNLLGSFSDFECRIGTSTAGLDLSSNSKSDAKPISLMAELFIERKHKIIDIANEMPIRLLSGENNKKMLLQPFRQSSSVGE
ncbi:MAG: hypothetical protein ACE5OZ_12045 [Candidatus Heimdallarchaeota archaeon]